MPPSLAAVIEEFASAPRDVVLEMMLEFADEVKPLPPGLAEHGEMEQVTECQTPFFLKAVVTPQDTVEVYFDCPPEAPTTRAFAGILTVGLDGATSEEVLAVPTDLYERMGLTGTISPLRIRGGTAVLTRLQRQVRVARAAASEPDPR